MIGATALIFPTIKGEGWSPPEALVAGLKAAYPCLDVEEEMLRAWVWCQANHKMLKTLRGMPRFLNAWVSRANKHRQEREAARMRPGQFYQPQRRVFGS